MTTATHQLGIDLHVYPGEMHLLLKAITHGQAYLEATHQLTQDDSVVLDGVLDELKDKVLNY